MTPAGRIRRLMKLDILADCLNAGMSKDDAARRIGVGPRHLHGMLRYLEKRGRIPPRQPGNDAQH